MPEGIREVAFVVPGNWLLWFQLGLEGDLPFHINFVLLNLWPCLYMFCIPQSSLDIQLYSELF